jgi:hypothetical protein
MPLLKGSGNPYCVAVEVPIPDVDGTGHRLLRRCSFMAVLADCPSRWEVVDMKADQGVTQEEIIQVMDEPIQP